MYDSVFGTEMIGHMYDIAIKLWNA